MKRLLIGLSLMFIMMSVSAQQKYSVEVGAGGILSFEKMVFDSNRPGFGAFAEIRHYFGSGLFDFGARLEYDNFTRVSAAHFNCNFPSVRAHLVGDLNHALSSSVTGFIGVGAGIGRIECPGQDMSWTSDGTFFSGGDLYQRSIQPRIGIQFKNHFRVTAAYTISDKANTYAGCYLGYVF